MILLVTPKKGGMACAGVLQQALVEPVTLARSLAQATARLRKAEYRAMILDAAMVEADPEGLDVPLSACGTAAPVYINMAISNAERVKREVGYALRRQAEAQTSAMRTAKAKLGSELRDALTGILLSVGLLLSAPDLSAATVKKLHTICRLAEQIRHRLDGRAGSRAGPHEPAPL